MENSREELLRTLVGALIGMAPADIPATDNLVRLGLGSLDMMRLSTRLRRAGVPVDFDVLITEPTLFAWLAHLDALHHVAGRR